MDERVNLNFSVPSWTHVITKLYSNMKKICYFKIYFTIEFYQDFVNETRLSLNYSEFYADY